ncbi:MAG: YdcF family protein [Clostridiales bacterium]|nr:YdcF family protein [Clostridiales bacterium]
MQGHHLSTFFRIIIFIFAGALLLDFIAVYISRAGRNIGGYTGIALCLLVMLYTALLPHINSWIAAAWVHGGKRKTLILVASAFVVVCCVTAIVETIFMGIYANKKAPASASEPVVIVLGCQVRNGQASLMLMERIETAYDYLVEHPEAKCIVSGGQGPDEAMSEAECMFKNLTAMGISADRIYKEDRSTTTRENLQFSKEIMEREGLGDTAMIVTHSWHELRAQMIAKTLDLPCGGVGAPTTWWLLPCNYLRELYAILYQLVF